MKVHWTWLPSIAVISALLSFMATTMTQNIWSAHTSYDCRVALSDYTHSHQQVLDRIEQTIKQFTHELEKLQGEIRATNAQVIDEMWQGIDLAHPDRKDRLKMERRIQALEHPDAQNLEQLP